MTLAGVRALVTGTSSGIGRALTIALATAGAEVVATARRLDSIVDLEGARVVLRELDVTDPDMVRRVVAEAGPVDVLVNNAGYGLIGAVEECADDELRTQYETNVFGPWRLIRAALPGMRDRGRGTIINVGSVGAHVPFPGLAAYRSSKAALDLMTWTLQLEVAHFGIRVFSVEPGLTATDFSIRSSRDASGMTAESPYAPMREAAESVYPQLSPTALDPGEVAAVVVAELERGAGPLRVRVGQDASRLAALGAAGDAVFERVLVEELGFGWHPLPDERP